MSLIDEHTKEHLKQDFETKLEGKVTITFFKGEPCQYCKEIEEIITTLKDLSSGKIEVEIYDFNENKDKAQEMKVEMYPALVITGEKHKAPNIKFYGIPSGYEFISLVEDIFMVSTGKNTLSDNTKEIIQGIKKPVDIKVFVTPSCPYCPRAVLMAHQLAMENEYIEGVMVEAMEFEELSQKHQVMAVPKIVINDKESFEGALPEPMFVQKIIEAISKE